MIAGRLGYAIGTLLVVSLLVFALTRLTGDPAFFLTGQGATEEDRQRVRAELGLDRPFFTQYVDYLGGLLRGDLGDSFRFGVPVWELIMQRVPATLQLATAAFVLTVVVAVPFGLYAAVHRNGLIDRAARFFAGFGQSVPSFWFGLLLILFFAVRLGWLPSGGAGGLEFLILPAITMAIEPMARLTRLLRSSMLEQLGSEYVRFHRMNGMPERQILWKHALRNAGLTALTYLGIITVGFLTGSVLVETVFVWPGVGRLLVEAIGYRDFAVVQGLVMLIAAAFILANLLVDILYMVLNPRIRVGGTT